MKVWCLKILCGFFTSLKKTNHTKIGFLCRRKDQVQCSWLFYFTKKDKPHKSWLFMQEKGLGPVHRSTRPVKILTHILFFTCVMILMVQCSCALDPSCSPAVIVVVQSNNSICVAIQTVHFWGHAQSHGTWQSCLASVFPTNINVSQYKIYLGQE